MLGLDGTTAALGNDVAVDASFSDVLDLLNIALSANMELSKGKFFVVFDPMYAQLEADYAGPGGGPVGGTIDIDMLIADLDVGYSMDENFDFYAGLRYYDQDIGITPNLFPKVTLGDAWTDYILGFRFHTSISDKWAFTGKLDGAVAGDSESAVYLQAVLLRHFGSNKHLDLGWRYYDVDYESGSGLTRFKWDVAHSGPVVGFSWEFCG
jgi:outer membrane receptor protein involved in Fe transport